jgi:hypothetical protein
MRNYLAIGVILLASANVSMAEDINAIFQKVNEYVSKENYSKALEELGWAKKELEKLHTAKLTKLLPDEIEGFKGEPSKSQSALGFNTIEKKYKNGTKVISVSLTSGNSEMMGGLAGLAKMGMMMGGAQEGEDSFRINGKTAVILDNGGNPDLTVFLDGGYVLKLDGRSGVDTETLKKFAQAIKLAEIETYLKGA